MKKNMYLTLLIVAISALIPVYFSRDQEEVIFYGEEEIVAEIDDSGDDTVVIDDPLVEGISLEDTENPSNEEMKDPPVDDDHLQNSERTKEYKETPTLPQTETPQIDTPTEQETPLSREIEQNYSTTEFTRATCETTPLHIPGTTFVIASCNVGASVAGTSTDSYGAYFQRGNNYAFPRTGSSTVSNTPVIPEIWYTSSIWITASPWGTGADWNNLRGGAGDTKTSNGPATMENRQGPCPSGYHVPSTLEWAELFAEYAHAKGFSYVTGGNLGLMCIVESPIMYSVSAIVRCIDPINDFKLPKVAPHSEPFCDEKGDCMVMAFRKGGFYRSSSSTGKYWYNVFIDEWNMSLTPQTTEATNVGMPVRCFSNLPYIEGTITYSPTWPTLWSVTATLTLNTTGEVTSTGWIGEGTTFTKVFAKNTYENVYFKNLQGDQTGSKYVSVSNIQPLGVLSYSTTTLTSGDVTVTLTLAETGQVLSPGRSGSWLVYTKIYTYDKTEEVRVKNQTRNREETLTVSINNIAKILNYVGQSCATAPDIEFGWGVENGGVTVQACNLGATVVGIWTSSYGTYFQRGNNYGFSWGSATSSQTVDTSAYGPSTYNDATFRNINGDRSDPYNQDLWGNLTDTEEARQGPCPVGYHVPTNEWNSNTIRGYLENKLQLPKAWVHHGDSIEGQNIFGLYRRSDYKNSSIANSFDFGVTEDLRPSILFPVYEEPIIDTLSTFMSPPMPPQFELHPANNSYWLQIRCFKNKPQIKGVVEVLPNPIEVEKETVTNQITLNQPGSILTPWWDCVEPSPCPSYDAYSGGTARIKTFTPSTLTEISEEVVFKDITSNATGKLLVYIPIVQQNQQSWSAGGVSLSKDTCPNDDNSPSYYDEICGGYEDEEHGSAEDWTSPTPSRPDEDKPSKGGQQTVYQSAYEWAKEYGITTASTYEEARTTDAILRQEMAKMISIYAIKLFQKTPDTSRIDCSQFSDLSQAGADLQSYIIQSCQLGLMGMDGDGIGVQESFLPKNSITRAEVGTVLSRLLRGTTYATQLGDETYYGRHLQALKKAGIMNFISNPDMIELRGNILLMFWKSVAK